jgi:hypothetical protein
MAGLIKFMVVHNDPNISWNKVEENWRELADIQAATWLRTFFNKKEGVRYCLWLAADEKKLRNIFDEFNVSWETILEVEETLPDLWGRKWQEHLKEEERADTLAF